jgi:predicted secreted protein
MRHSEQLSITIPSQLLEELTKEIAVKVAARLKAQMHEVTSAPSVPAAFEEPKFKPTFLRLAEVAERIGFSRSTIYNKMNEWTSQRLKICSFLPSSPVKNDRDTGIVIYTAWASFQKN